MEMVQKKTFVVLTQHLHLREKALLLCAWGLGAASFLFNPSVPACSMEDARWATALRSHPFLRRLGCSQAELARASATCQHGPSGASAI